MILVVEKHLKKHVYGLQQSSENYYWYAVVDKSERIEN